MEILHKKSFVWRDIDPNNVINGFNNLSDEIFILHCYRFKKFMDPKTGKHIPYKENKGYLGDPIYGSINQHLGIEVSRRDDIESLAYMAYSLLKG